MALFKSKPSPSKLVLHGCCLHGYPMHPPKADDISILDHLLKSLALVESKYRKCGFLISGALNRLDINRLLTHFHVKQIVKVPPHKDATLDLVVTNMHELHTSPLAFPPFRLSDHSAVVASPTSQKVNINGQVVR